MSEWDVPLSLNPASGRMIKRPTGADRKRNRRLQEDAPESPTTPTPPHMTEASEYDRLLAAVTSESHAVHLHVAARTGNASTPCTCPERQHRCPASE
ncbi:hypothetical protein [Gluconobacter sphaericus]|uniref:hypothetical protein n=1 Tax=Gluconobacter sphaericus TaxID=574987 RepID=UPI001D1703D5|nr:hypothetical protein [Gluconobacter sphaericus]